ncbi:MAG: hypothetical protein SGARI_002888, partial [Bacillariaceae sp.]
MKSDVPENGEAEVGVEMRAFELAPMRLCRWHTSLAAVFSSKSCFDYWHNSGESRFFKELPAATDVLLKITEPKYPKDALWWALDDDYKWTHPAVSANVAKRGDETMFLQAMELEMPTSPLTTMAAAAEGHTHIIHHASKLQVEMDASACAFAAKGGRLNALQCLRKLDCPWDSRVLQWAANFGHAPLFDWALKHGAPVDLNMAHVIPTASAGHLRILLRLQEVASSFV